MSLADSYRGKRVLVTGDTGFKGSWLAIWLRELGAEVTGFAQPPSTVRDNFVTCGLTGVIAHVDGDVRDLAQLAAVVQQCRPEIVFHLAAQSLVLESYARPHETFETNVMGVVNVLEAVRGVPSVRAVVIVTSDKCYREQDRLRRFVETDPLGGHDPYSASKGAAELVAASMRDSLFGGRVIATARAGNVIGGGDWAAHRLVPDCIRSLQAGEPIVLRMPQAIRPWQHVLDALHGYLQLAAALVREDDRFASAWNFGPEESDVVPVSTVVDAVLAHWGSGTSRVEGTISGAEARVLMLDISKAREQLGWRPILRLDRAIQLAVAGYRAELAAPETTLAHRIAQIRAFESAAHG